MRIAKLTHFLWITAMLQAGPYPGTAPLAGDGDQAALMLDGMHAWLDRELHTAAEAGRAADVGANREALAAALGVTGKRARFLEPERYRALGAAGGVKMWAIRWPVLSEARAELTGEGVLLEPAGEPRCQVVALPNFGLEPEQLAGLAPGLPLEEQWARRWATAGCAVLVMPVLDRTSTWSRTLGVRPSALSHREYIYRMSYQMGRHLIGYEVEKVLAAVDWMTRHAPGIPIGVAGEGDGGMLALFAAALDDRLRSVAVNGYEAPDETVWQQPLDRNVFGLLRYANRAKLRQMIEPRTMAEGAGAAGLLLRGLGVNEPPPAGEPAVAGQQTDPGQRQRRQFVEMVNFTQALVRAADGERARYWKGYDRSKPETLEPYRERFAEFIGKLPGGRPAEPVRSRQIYDTPAFQGWEVKLPVAGEVFAYGILLVPKDMKPGERRPLVVAQHGLEGRPQLLVDPGKDEYSRLTYGAFAARLAERGFIVYAPQTPYILGDRFRQAQRKANPLGLTFFSFAAAQHRRTLDWLKTLPVVDETRIGFYGLSYGGFSAMRLPVLLREYSAVVCSGNFNEWTWKTTSIDVPFSYMFTPEYEMPEFGQGSRFGHFEMARMIAPRPFLVERGHRDGVGIDEWVAYEFAKVARHYREAGIPERAAITYFDGIHRIEGTEAFRFLDRWLRWTPAAQK